MTKTDQAAYFFSFLHSSTFIFNGKSAPSSFTQEHRDINVLKFYQKRKKKGKKMEWKEEKMGNMRKISVLIIHKAALQSPFSPWLVFDEDTGFLSGR